MKYIEKLIKTLVCLLLDCWLYVANEIIKTVISRPDSSWYTHHLLKQKRLLRKAELSHLNHTTDNYLLHYKTLNNTYRKQITVAKNSSISKFSSIEKNSKSIFFSDFFFFTISSVTRSPILSPHWLHQLLPHLNLSLILGQEFPSNNFKLHLWHLLYLFLTILKHALLLIH